MGFDLVVPIRRLGVSAAWLSHPFDCTVDHIVNCCGGSCCRGSVHWPSKLYPELGHCGFLGEHGCILPMSERPITCNIFPIVINKHDVLIMFQRSMFKKGMCKGAFDKGDKMLIDTQREGLIGIFGQEQYDRVRNDVVNGRDSYFDVSEEMWQRFQSEARMEDESVKPTPRTSGTEIPT